MLSVNEAPDPVSQMPERSKTARLWIHLCLCSSACTMTTWPHLANCEGRDEGESLSVADTSRPFLSERDMDRTGEGVRHKDAVSARWQFASSSRERVRKSVDDQRDAVTPDCHVSLSSFHVQKKTRVWVIRQPDGNILYVTTTEQTWHNFKSMKLYRSTQQKQMFSSFTYSLILNKEWIQCLHNVFLTSHSMWSVCSPSAWFLFFSWLVSSCCFLVLQTDWSSDETKLGRGAEARSILTSWLRAGAGGGHDNNKTPGQCIKSNAIIDPPSLWSSQAFVREIIALQHNCCCIHRGESSLLCLSINTKPYLLLKLHSCEI